MSTTPSSASHFTMARDPHYTFQTYDPYSEETPVSSTREAHSFALPLLSKQHQPAAPAISTVDGKTKRLSWALILPTAIVILVTAGAATTLILWVYWHTAQNDWRDVWKDGAFILSEGVKSKDGFQAAKLLALTISSAASSAVGVTTPILMSLYAFRTAHAWLSMSKEHAVIEQSSLPTPLQYGLILQLLSASGVVSLIDTSRYFLRHWSKRARATRLLVRAFLVALVVYTVSHAIGAVDIWLHATTSTIIFQVPSPLDTPFAYGVSQMSCQPYPPDFWNASPGCASMAELLAPEYPQRVEGMLATANSSNNFRAITLADESDLAVIVRPAIEKELRFQAPTFGARATCDSVNSRCQIHPGPASSSNVTCEGFPAPFPPVPISSKAPQVLQPLRMLWSNCAWDNTNCDHEERTFTTFNDKDKAPQNAYNLWMQFVWERAQTGSGGSPRVNGWAPLELGDNHAINGFNGDRLMLANCTVSFYNATVSYDSGNYTLLSKDLLDAGVSDGLAAALINGRASSALIANVQGRAFSANTTQGAMAYLEQDLARLALAASADLMNVTLPTAEQARLENTIVGRYPFWPIVILVALLYVHAAIALLIFLRTSLFTRAEVLRVPGQSGNVSALELAQMRLTSPLAIVAALFPPQRPVETHAALSAKTTALDMFGEQRGEERLRVGLQRDGLERTAGFGVWRRQEGSDHRRVYHNDKLDA